jgi:GNAT superfamily N-acetyltransferase
VTMPLLIRTARASDHDALVEQFQGLHIYEDAITHDRATDRTGAEECLVDANQRVAAKDGAALVAELDGRVVGHLFLSFEVAPPFVRNEMRRYAYVFELFVRDEARRAGVGKALVQEAERIALERGVDTLMLSVLAGNSIAEAFYRREGFAPYATELIKMLG